MELPDLPPWIIYLGGFFGVIGSTLVLRLGWNKSEGGGERPEQGRIMGAIVDSASVRNLTLAIEANTEVSKSGFEHVETLGNELRNLGDEVRRLANKVERA